MSRSRSESLHEWGLTPLTEGIGRRSLYLPMVAVPDRHQCRGRGMQHLGVKHSNVVYRQGCNGLLAANRCVTVRMLTVEEAQESAIGDDSRDVTELCQTMQSKLADTFEVRFSQRRVHDHVGKKPECLHREPAQRGNAENCRIRSDVGIELRSDAGERLVHFDRRPAAAAFVEHVGRQRRKTVRFPAGSLAEPPRISRTSEITGTVGWRTVHRRRPFGSTDFSIDGSVKGRAALPAAGRDLSIFTTRRPWSSREWRGPVDLEARRSTSRAG